MKGFDPSGTMKWWFELVLKINYNIKIILVSSHHALLLILKTAIIEE